VNLAFQFRQLEMCDDCFYVLDTCISKLCGTELPTRARFGHTVALAVGFTVEQATVHFVPGESHPPQGVGWTSPWSGNSRNNSVGYSVGLRRAGGDSTTFADCSL
jgi:hypothetical protein